MQHLRLRDADTSLGDLEEEGDGKRRTDQRLWWVERDLGAMHTQDQEAVLVERMLLMG